MVWFAYGMQLAMVGLITNVVWRQPQVLVPTLGLGVSVLVWRALSQKIQSRPAALIGAVVVGVLASAVIVMVVDPPTQTVLERFWHDVRGR
jgi:hypothetical protein